MDDEGKECEGEKNKERGVGDATEDGAGREKGKCRRGERKDGGTREMKMGEEMSIKRIVGKKKKG